MASQIYDVTVFGSGSLDGMGRLGATIEAGCHVEGAHQVSLVMEWAKANGLKARFASYHGKSADEAIDTIKSTFAKFGVPEPTAA